MPDPREPLGRTVHDTRLACEAERAALEGRARFNLEPWERRSYEQQESDMRIGEAVAQAERERIAAAAARLVKPSPMADADVHRTDEAVTEYTNAIAAIRAGLNLAAPFHDEDAAVITEARRALKVLSGEEGASDG